MSEEQSFEQLLEESFKSKTIRLRNGEVVEGRVIDVFPDEMHLDIGYKLDGTLTREEYSNDVQDLTKVVQPGDTMEVKVLKVNENDGQVFVS